ncbi:MAG: phosphatidylinositol-specific phospholipase C domain-containing protein [Bdellovibrionota bacterium]
MAILLSLVASSCAPGDGSFSEEDQPAPWLLASATDWMADIPDDRPMRAISIPGTHDTAARLGGIAFQTQSWDIPNQLGAGIRYLDIRTRRTQGAGIHCLAIHHGSLFQGIWLNEVLDEVGTFLGEHPRETVIMRLRADEFPAESGSLGYPEIWPSYLESYPGLFYDRQNTQPTLGELRGKIFVLDDGASLMNHGMEWQGVGTETQDSFYVWAFTWEWLAGNNASIVTKRELVNQYLAIARDPKNRSWVFNHLSGAGAMAPRDVARSVNSSAFDNIGSDFVGTLGTLIMDYPGEALVQRVIQSNLKASQKK